MNNRNLLEKDAIPTGSSKIPAEEDRTNIVRQSQARNVVENRVLNQNMLLQQSNSTTNYTFNNARGLQLGTVINIGGQPNQRGPNDKLSSSERSVVDKIFRKTPTIKEMMESEKEAKQWFLDLVSKNLGHQWRPFSYLIEKNPKFIERMVEDHFTTGGSEMVVMQVLTKYFHEHKEHRTIGWLTTFLWANNFKETVHAIKESYKMMTDDSD